MTSRRDANEHLSGVVEWSERWTRDPEVPSSGPTPSSFKSKATLCKWPAFFSSSLFASSNSKCVSVVCLNASSVQLRA